MSISPETAAIDRVVAILAQLRGPGGCPWDRAQTPAALKPQLLEECYEVLEAIDGGRAEDLKEELGDLLLHVIFQAELAREQGDFSLTDVAEALAQKLVRRHPHVFGDEKVTDTAGVKLLWQEVKRAEKPQRVGIFEGIPAALPSLMRAHALQSKAAHVGFDWPDAAGAWAKLKEELGEVLAEIEAAPSALPGDPRLAEELGDLLFSLVNVTRHLKLDAEQLLSAANAKFVGRFEAMAAHVRSSGRAIPGATLAEMEAAWQLVKRDGAAISSVAEKAPAFPPAPAKDS